MATRTKPLITIELRDVPREIVRVGPTSRKDMADISRRYASLGEGVESGGLCFAVERSWNCGQLSVAAIVHSGTLARRQARRFAADTFHDQRIIEVMREKRGLAEIGSWHSHVDFGELPREQLLRPSEADLAQWVGMRDLLALPRFLGLIVVVSATRWERPELTAWLVRAGSDREHAICEPAVLL